MPLGIILASDGFAASTAVQANARTSWGMFDGVDHCAISSCHTDVTLPSVGKHSSNTLADMRLCTGSTLDSEGVATLGTRGFNMNWNTNNAVASQILYVAMGLGTSFKVPYMQVAGQAVKRVKYW